MQFNVKDDKHHNTDAVNKAIAKKELKKIENRLKTLEPLIDKVFEKAMLDNDTLYTEKLKQYKSERSELSAKYKQLKTEIDTQNDTETDIDEFIKTMKILAKNFTLNRELIVRIIENSTIPEVKSAQAIRINYRFMC